MARVPPFPAPRSPLPSWQLSKFELQSHSHRPRFDCSPRREEITQTSRAEINELRAEAEDRRVERIERLDLNLGFAALTEFELARQPQVERVAGGPSTRVARQIARGSDSREREPGDQRGIERLAGATPDDSVEVAREIGPVVIHVVEVSVGATDADAERERCTVVECARKTQASEPTREDGAATDCDAMAGVLQTQSAFAAKVSHHERR